VTPEEKRAKQRESMRALRRERKVEEVAKLVGLPLSPQSSWQLWSRPWVFLRVAPTVGISSPMAFGKDAR